MRALCLGTATVLFATMQLALAESRWLDSRRLDEPEIAGLCGRISEVRLLARMQMISSGNARWRRLSRQELVIEAAVMGIPPLDPGRCYLVARAGPLNESERRAFEVRDFIVGIERTSVFLIGGAYDLPLGGMYPGR